MRGVDVNPGNSVSKIMSKEGGGGKKLGAGERKIKKHEREEGMEGEMR